MKVQFGGNAVVIGSKKLNQKNPKAVQSALSAPKGKAKLLEITLTDDNGQECVFTAPLRPYKGGSFGAYLSMKAEAKIITVDAPESKESQAEAKDAAKLEALTEELLG